MKKLIEARYEDAGRAPRNEIDMGTRCGSMDRAFEGPRIVLVGRMDLIIRNARILRDAELHLVDIGVSGGKFFNQLIAARLDYRFTPTLSLGPSLAYANLKGKDGRTSNVLASILLEYRPSLADGSSFSLPLRLAPGYLPQNGPVLRLSAGIAYALSPHVDLVLDAFTPTFLVIKNGTVVSLGGALELSYAP